MLFGGCEIWKFHSVTPLTLTPSFLTFNLLQSRLITNPPTSLGSLLISYNATLSSLLDKHAPIISKLSKSSTKSNPWFTPTLHAFRSKVRHAETYYKHTHSPLSWLSFKSLRNRYHNLILIAKKNSIPTLSPLLLVIHVISGKPSINLFIVNLHHH